MKRRVFGTSHTLAVSAAVLVAGGMIALAVVWGFDRIAGEVRQAAAASAESKAPAAAAPVVAVSFEDVSLKDTPFIGSATAPVGMAYWFDYQCPFCRRVEDEVMPRLIEEYVKPGKLRIYFKDYQFLGQDSYEAAIASRAVWEVAPALFGTWHSALFARQDRENGGWGSRDDVFALLDTVPGLDAGKVKQLVAQKVDDYVARMDRDLQEGSRFGIQGTPGTIIGARLISGAGSFEEFQAAVEEALTKKR